MTATDVAVRDPQATAIPAKLQYARALAESGLLPAAYRKNPANVLWAVEYGDMLGLVPDGRHHRRPRHRGQARPHPPG